MVDRLCVLVLVINSVFSSLAGSAKVKQAYVTKTPAGDFQIKSGISQNFVAKASFANGINETGWSYLTVTTNGDSYTDSDQAYAAGLVEGYLTKELITYHWVNTVRGQFCDEPMTPECVKMKKFLEANLQWMRNQISLWKNDPYWHMVELFLIQVNGLTDGYNNNPGVIDTDIDVFGLFVLSLSGDMEDIPAALGFQKFKREPVGSGSCSALIKLLPGNQDLYVAQDTWTSYQDMIRVLKKYDFGYHMTSTGKDMVPGRVMTMSSYPGVLLSGDDYYLISSGLATLETTIGNSNPERSKYIQPAGVLEGIRVMAANRLTSNGMDWGKVFEKYNSGTYNNQWMIVDFKQFVSGSTSMKGLLTVLEQIPGEIIYDDQTDLLLKRSYWPSYNIAFYPKIFNDSGCWDNVRKYGAWFTYDGSPRAQIFKRDNVKVKDLASMTQLMRYNNFQHDPLSRCNCTPPYSGENAISARSDLNPASGTYPFGALGHRSHGGTDMKLTNSTMFKNLEFIAVSGPTYDQQPPFQWSKADFAADCPHVGQPDIFKFEPIYYDGSFDVDSHGEMKYKIFKRD